MDVEGSVFLRRAGRATGMRGGLRTAVMGGGEGRRLWAAGGQFGKKIVSAGGLQNQEPEKAGRQTQRQRHHTFRVAS